MTTIAIILGSIAIILIAFLLYGRSLSLKKAKQSIMYNLSQAPTKDIVRLWQTDLRNWQRKLFKQELLRRGVKV